MVATCKKYMGTVDGRGREDVVVQELSRLKERSRGFRTPLLGLAGGRLG